MTLTVATYNIHACVGIDGRFDPARTLGVLQAGAFADFAVLSKDLFTTPPNEITSIKVVRTVVGGKDVFVAR